MALTIVNPDSASQRVATILAQLSDEAEHQRTLQALRRRVRAYELRFQLQSADLHRAIDAGEVDETDDVCQWILDYHVLLRAGKA